MMNKELVKKSEEIFDYLSILHNQFDKTVLQLSNENVNEKFLGFYNLGMLVENIKSNITSEETYLEELKESEDEEVSDKDPDEKRYITFAEVKKYFNGFKNH